MVKIIGATGGISDTEEFLKKINSFAQKNKIEVQVLNADLVYGKKHLVSSVFHAYKAFQNKNNTSNSIAMEILLYASGERQLKKAIPKMGIKNGRNNIAIIFAYPTDTNKEISNGVIDNFLKFFNLERNDKVLEGDINTLKRFGISKSEIETVSKDKYGDLILEKVALVDIIK